MTSGLFRLLALIMLMFAQSASAQSVAPGRYRAAQGPELAAQLEIRADGHFAYFLAYGALDESAEGTWMKAGNGAAKGIVLTTQPKPKPPEFRLDHEGPEGEALFNILVQWPDGRGIAGVDFRLGFANGTVIDGYTQAYGWSLGDPERGMPLWIELIEPMHGFTSPRLSIRAGIHSMTVTLVPNDMGIAAFENTLFEAAVDGSYVLHHPMGDIRFSPAHT